MEAFDVDRLEKLVDERLELRKDNAPAADEDWLAVAAAYALDLYHVADDDRVNIDLDFTSGTYNCLGAAIGFSHHQLIGEGKTASESREILAKRLASYMLFITYNDLCSLELEPRMDVGPESMAITVEDPAGNKYSFDFLKRAKFTMSRFSLSEQGEDPSTGGTLSPMHRKLFEDMMGPIFEAVNPAS